MIKRSERPCSLQPPRSGDNRYRWSHARVNRLKSCSWLGTLVEHGTPFLCSSTAFVVDRGRKVPGPSTPASGRSNRITTTGPTRTTPALVGTRATALKPSSPPTGRRAGPWGRLKVPLGRCQAASAPPPVGGGEKSCWGGVGGTN